MTMYTAPQLPLAWIVSDGDALYIVPARHNGWAYRKPYRGHRAALKNVPSYNAIGLCIPVSAQ